MINKDKRKDKVLLEIYTELYKKSEPSADFNHLVEISPKNEHGQTVIDFMRYEISMEHYERIIESILRKHKWLNNYDKIQLRNNAALGCSPKFKR